MMTAKYEENGAITATIIAEDTSGGGTATYALGTQDSVEIAVTSDDQSVPVISITSDFETYGVTKDMPLTSWLGQTVT